MAADQVIQSSSDALFDALEQAQNTLEMAVIKSDFNTAKCVNAEMDLHLKELFDLPTKQVSTNLYRLTQIADRHKQAQARLAQKMTDMQRRLRRNQTAISVYSKP
ncbi:hypothetical protein OAN307_c29800 [Octadecabacter antarcticus 307]|uniref:Uncharacterized protein n=1 Tax=Octadecabacter antarcticus 307 TaxID=391626 RepID=M9RFE6_9RHOB|nr:hypothetical protein [Octadecabacter antarcticus]AGI68530.1 hypothetical protein OAN307_c29800 [Octadecabacter antarcticus 307]